jgi:rhodanese-related sulfurtransferase
MGQVVTRAQVQASLASSPRAVLLEALAAKHYLDGHLPGALHFPHDQVRTLAPKMVADKQAPIIVYCASDTCRNSHIAAAALEGLGYANVSVYAGGKKDWVEAGLPLDVGGRAEAA